MKKQCNRKVTPYKWLRDLISSVDFGQQYVKSDGKIACPHVNTNNDILNAFNQRQWWRLGRLRNRDFDSHFDGHETLFFAGGRGARSLILIDVDCKRRGSPEGATAFCDFLSETFFPGLYHEASRSGKGRHGYFLLENWGVGASMLNDLLLQRLTPHLNQLADGFDVELVEIKGTFPVFAWGTERGKLGSVRCGCLGKLPREVSRFDEWQKTTVLSISDLMRLPVAPKKQMTPNPTKASITKARLSTCPLSGSCSGVPVTEDELERLPNYIDVANNLVGEIVLRTTGRHVVTPEDAGIFFMLGNCFTKSMNADGTMPRARFESVWTALYDGGRVARPFCRKRFKAIRDFMSQSGLLDWKDETYRVSTVFDEQGRGLNGVASKWQFTEMLMDMLTADVIREESILGGTGNPEALNMRPLVDRSVIDTLTEELFVRPKRVFSGFDHLSATRRVDEIVKSWMPNVFTAA